MEARRLTSDRVVPVVTAALALAIGVSMPWLTGPGRLLGITLAAALLLLAAHWRFGSALLSPVQIVGGGLIVLALLGRAFYQSVATAPGGGAIVIQLSDELSDATLFTIMAGSAALLGGALLVGLAAGRRGRTGIAALRAIRLPPASLRLIAIGVPVPLIMMVLGYGPARLLRRSIYIDSTIGQNAFAALGTTVSVAAIPVLGYLWGARRTRPWVGLLLACYTLAFLGLGSRRLALVPILFGIGVFAARPARSTRWGLLVAGVLSVYLIGLPLQFRALSSHGVIPYLQALPKILAAQHPWAATGRNLLISYALIGRTAFGQVFPVRDLWISVNPLPGGIAGWYDIAAYHRLNLYTPTAGLGELRNAGWPLMLVTCALIGACLAVIDLRITVQLARGRQVLGLAMLMLSGLFLLLLVQYNLRSAARMIYYAFAVDVIGSLLLAYRPRLARRPGTGPPGSIAARAVADGPTEPSGGRRAGS